MRVNPGRYRSSLNLSIYQPVSKRNGKKNKHNIKVTIE